jgi:transcriptional regulator with XRE-family HTH domain
MTPEAKALRELRLDKGLSIREVCKQLDKSEGFLRHIETGRRDFPRKIVLETILKVYEATYNPNPSLTNFYFSEPIKLSI